MKTHPLLFGSALLVGCGSEAPVMPHASAPQIVFQSPGIPGGGVTQELYTMDLDGSHLTQRTNDGLNHFLAHFSPDGTKLLYSRFLSGQYGDPAAPTEIAVYDFSTGKETQMANVPRAFQPAWSPDGLHFATGTYDGSSIWIMNADGSQPRQIATPSGATNDLRWADLLWTNDNWLVFTVAQNTNKCLKSRLDKMRPDGTARTQVSDGGPNCTPAGMENYGDADPGVSPDGQVVYTSRGLGQVPGVPAETLRHLYALSSSAWSPGKLEADLSQSVYPQCVVGVPKASPDGSTVLVYLRCLDDLQHAGIWRMRNQGTSWTFITQGFGADWNRAPRLEGRK